MAAGHALAPMQPQPLGPMKVTDGGSNSLGLPEVMSIMSNDMTMSWDLIYEVCYNEATKFFLHYLGHLYVGHVLL